MKNRIDTAQGAAEYTMGIKFQMKLEINESFMKEISKDCNRMWRNSLSGVGILVLIIAVYFMMLRKTSSQGIIFLGLAAVLIILGITASLWVPKARLLLLKLKKKDGTHKITVYETEFLIYSEKYQTCQTLSLKDMERWEKKEGIYWIWLPGKTFAFREKDFLSGNASAFEVFLNETDRKSI